MTIHLSVFLLTLDPRFKLSESRIDRHRSDMLYTETGNALLDLPGQLPVLHIRGDPSVPELLLILRRLPFRPTGKRVTPSELTVEIGKHTSELQSRGHLVCRLLLEKNKINT